MTIDESHTNTNNVTNEPSTISCYHTRCTIYCLSSFFLTLGYIHDLYYTFNPLKCTFCLLIGIGNYRKLTYISPINAYIHTTNDAMQYMAMPWSHLTIDDIFCMTRISYANKSHWRGYPFDNNKKLFMKFTC